MAKELTVEEQVAQAVAKANRELELKQQQREENSVSIGARVMSKRIQNGSPIVDKDTKEQRVDGNGIPQCYPDKFHVTLQFMGAEIEKEIKQEQYELLEEMRMYSCKGYIGEVKKFGNTFVEPIFTSFTQI